VGDIVAGKGGIELNCRFTNRKAIGLPLEGFGELIRDWPRIPDFWRPVEFSRPVYPYPLVTMYSGRGDPKSADSFGPVTPKP
jgi:hypothetical protein